MIGGIFGLRILAVYLHVLLQVDFCFVFFLLSISNHPSSFLYRFFFVSCLILSRSYSIPCLLDLCSIDTPDQVTSGPSPR